MVHSLTPPGFPSASRLPSWLHLLATPFVGGVHAAASLIRGQARFISDPLSAQQYTTYYAPISRLTLLAPFIAAIRHDVGSRAQGLEVTKMPDAPRRHIRNIIDAHLSHFLPLPEYFDAWLYGRENGGRYFTPHI